MISRIWHGYTTLKNADIYEKLLKEEIFVGIKSRNIEGFKEIQLFRRSLQEEVEFITIMWFTSIEAVIKFAGENYENCVVPTSARKVLKRFDLKSQHYEVKERLEN